MIQDHPEALQNRTYNEISPHLMAMTTAVIRLQAPSFRIALDRWNSTVFSDVDEISPISQLVFPSLHQRRHSNSFAVRCISLGAGGSLSSLNRSQYWAAMA